MIEVVEAKEKLKFKQEEEMYYSNIRPRWYIVKGGGMTRYYWDLFVLVLALYNSVMTPFQFSFDFVMNKVEQKQSPFFEIELTIDFIYIFDILVNFLTSFIDDFTGDEIFGPKLIAKYYLAGDFVIDFLSTFWFVEFSILCGVETAVGPVNWQKFILLFQIFKLLKVLRLRKVDKLIRGANSTVESKATM